MSRRTKHATAKQFDNTEKITFAGTINASMTTVPQLLNLGRKERLDEIRSNHPENLFLS